MKKFYAFAAATVAAMTINAQTVVSLAGGYNGWSADANPMEETSAGVYEIKIDKLTKEFKVVVTETVDETSSQTWYGLEGGAITLGEPAVLGTGDDNVYKNITFANGWDAIANAVVKFELPTLTLTVTGEEATVEVHYGIHGSFATGDWATVDFEKAGDDLWVKTFNFEADAVGQFGIKQMDETGNQLAWIAAAAAGILIEDEIEDIELATSEASNLDVNLPAGDWTFTFNAKDLLLSVSKGAAGIDSVVVEENAPAVYYNLQGVKVANPENGVYIMRQGDKATKVLVK